MRKNFLLSAIAGFFLPGVSVAAMLTLAGKNFVGEKDLCGARAPSVEMSCRESLTFSKTKVSFLFEGKTTSDEAPYEMEGDRVVILVSPAQLSYVKQGVIFRFSKHLGSLTRITDGAVFKWVKRKP